ncbi:MAG: DUF4834 family protein [Prevotella sp.]
MFIIKFILFLIIAIALLFGLGLFSIMNKIQNNMRGHDRQGRRNTGYGSNPYGTNGSHTSHANRPGERKKIIPKDEGEYVDFTEE